MDPDFWQGRWREGKIGFHEGAPNAYLRAHLPALGQARRVLVPLCGKAEDLAFLASDEGGAREVVGVELVEDAVRAFFAEHGWTPSREVSGALVRYTHGRITVFAGDLFATTPNVLGPLDGWYDRAALIALPPELRGRYVAHVRSLLSPGAHGLVVTVAYPQALRAGPPFSVPDEELRAHLADCGLQRLASAKAGGALESVPATESCHAVRLPQA
jgi:thiopurine S-methyltransferase